MHARKQQIHKPRSCRPLRVHTSASSRTTNRSSAALQKRAAYFSGFVTLMVRLSMTMLFSTCSVCLRRLYCCAACMHAPQSAPRPRLLAQVVLLRSMHARTHPSQHPGLL